MESSTQHPQRALPFGIFDPTPSKAPPFGNFDPTPQRAPPFGIPVKPLFEKRVLTIPKTFLGAKRSFYRSENKNKGLRERNPLNLFCCFLEDHVGKANFVIRCLITYLLFAFCAFLSTKFRVPFLSTIADP
ncbi:MAG: hypothetical protein IJY89_05095, partial [Clostridia bacterium]|nr:hypothetical protein [Clostridia bacterium]